MRNLNPTIIVLAIAFCSCALSYAQDIPSMLGGVASSTQKNDESFINGFSSANVSGVRNPRISIYPNRYWNAGTNQPTPELLDNLVLMAHDHGQDIMMYFIHYLEESGDPGDYAKWFAIGQAFAGRFGKNSAWLASQGITDWGSTTFMAFNEPWHNSKNWDPQVFKDCMDGLGDGVHSVNPDFVVTPGGMPTYLLPEDNPLIGAITPLLNDGTLDGLTFHLYNDTRRDRPWRMDYEFNSQAVFDTVKSHWGITADIYYHVTEYMPKADDEADKAKYFLLHTWSNLGVVGNAGQPVTRHIAPFQYSTTTAGHPQFGMADVDWLWQGNVKGRAYQMVSRLTAGMQFVSLDPGGSGEFVLEGDGKRLIVWQNAEGWTDHPGSTFTVENIPAGATRLEVYRYDSWTQLYGGHGGIPNPFQSINLSGETSYTVTDVPTGECYMFMLYYGGVRNQHPMVSITNITEDQVFSEGDSITISASVVDVDSQIEEVRFFTDRNYIEVLRTPPYEITLPNVPLGRTQLIVTARDEHGGFNVATVNVIVEPRGEFIRTSGDAYVRGDINADINYGSDLDVISKFHTRLKDRYDAYFKFDLSAIPFERVDSAYLRLRVNRQGASDINMHWVEDDSWDENTLTWNNKPTAGDPFLTFVPGANGEWMKMDITALVNTELGGDKKLSLMLLPEKLGQDTKFYAKERSIYNAAFVSYKKLNIEVEITSPADSAEFAIGSDVTLVAAASDTSSAITKVEFFQDVNKIGEATNAPYAITWENPPAGNYLITAVATNAEGDTRSDDLFVKVVDPDKFFLAPVEDTYVRRGNDGGLNFGTSEILTVKQGGPNFQFNALLKFDLSGIPREVIEAKLRLFVIEDDNRGGDPDHGLFYVSDDSWEEYVVTWDTKPAADTELVSLVAPDLDRWIEYNVTDQINNEISGDDMVSFLINASKKTEIGYASRENGRFAIRPQLVIATLPVPPQAPVLTTVPMSDTRIDLTWSTNIGKVDGFIIERKTAENGEFMEIATMGVDSIYMDTTLTCETAYIYRVKAYNAGSISDYSDEMTDSTRLCPNGQTPYGGVPWAIPGTIEAEGYDEGGEGVAYHDLHRFNLGREYRPSEGVDVGSVRNAGGYYVGWIWKGEWLEYTVDVAMAGNYDIDLTIASWTRKGKLHIAFERVDKTGIIDVPRTWGWQRWKTVSVEDVDLAPGKQIMRIHMDGGLFNLNNITFNESNSGNAVARRKADNSANNGDLMEIQLTDIRIYPNPTRGVVTISGVGEGKVSVFNAVGQNLIDVALEPNMEIDMSDFREGIYLFLIRSEGENTMYRIIKE